MKRDDAMDEALRAKTAALRAQDDETGDGRIDPADLKYQLDRIEAQLELQDEQNRRLLRNQRLRFVLNGIVLAVMLVLAVVLFAYTRHTYGQILQASEQVNTLAATLQGSLAKLDTEQLDQMMQAMPDLVDQLSRIDVDALNGVMEELPGVIDSMQKMQEDLDQLRGWFSGLGSLFGG